MKKIFIISVLTSLLFTSCASFEKGKFSFALIDIDIRTKEQLQGLAVLEMAQRGEIPDNLAMELKAIDPITFLSKVGEIFIAVRGHWRLGYFEINRFPNKYSQPIKDTQNVIINDYTKIPSYLLQTNNIIKESK